MLADKHPKKQPKRTNIKRKRRETIEKQEYIKEKGEIIND